MHYNLNERITPKRHLPIKKIILLTIGVLVAIALYLGLTGHVHLWQKAGTSQSSANDQPT